MQRRTDPFARQDPLLGMAVPPKARCRYREMSLFPATDRDISNEERFLLHIIRTLGFKRAVDRLMGAGLPDWAGQGSLE